MTDGLSASDVAVLSRDNDGFGNGSWWILFLLSGMCGRGFGHGEGYGESPLVASEFTRVNDDFLYTNMRGDVQAGFASVQRDTDRIDIDVRGGFAGIEHGLHAMDVSNLHSFNGVGREIAQLGSQMQSCCCETNRNIDAVRYEAAKNTCDIIQANNCNTQKIIDMFTQTTIQDLRDKLQDQKFENSQLVQNGYIVGQLQPVAKPAYMAANPYATGCANGYV